MRIELLKFIEIQRFRTTFQALLLLMIPLVSQAQVDTKIDTAHIKIGMPIHYTLSVQFNKNSKVTLPQLKDTLSHHIEILDQKIDTVKENNQLKLVQKLTLTAYDPGQFLIRSLPVVINKDTLLSHSFDIQVDDVKIDSANLGGFPVKPIMDVSYTWKDYWNKYKFIALFLLLAIAALIFIGYWYKKRKKITENLPAKTPFEQAMDALKELDSKKYISKGQIKNYYSDLSFLLRRYLGRIYDFSSLELLSDDLVDYLKNSNPIDKTEIDRLRQFLFDSDLVKYAKAIPEESKHELYRRWVEDLIKKTKPVEVEIENDESNKKETKS